MNEENTYPNGASSPSDARPMGRSESRVGEDNHQILTGEMADIKNDPVKANEVWRESIRKEQAHYHLRTDFQVVPKQSTPQFAPDCALTNRCLQC